ncbi:MAG TPA: alpha/beta fold hydrolase [Gaiellaceae bacterium]|nr:alpha/beta fold hydrolase [Gaiellaceae bacterium]
MATFVLVHGAWGSGRVWEKVAPLLEAAGHRVDAVDLPGHGDNPAPAGEMTLDANARLVADRVEAADGPVVLVGHSMGGMSVTQAAELVPDRIATLVYLTAFLPGDGQSLAQLAGGDSTSLVGPNLVVDEAAGTCRIKDAAVRETFYGECSEDDARAAAARRVPESLAAIAAPVAISEERAGVIPRVYIECLRDRAIGIAKQREMWAARPCGQVFTLDTDHSPQLSKPQETAELLLAVAAA